jgi:hypothetical protein
MILTIYINYINYKYCKIVLSNFLNVLKIRYLTGVIWFNRGKLQLIFKYTPKHIGILASPSVIVI